MSKGTGFPPQGGGAEVGTDLTTKGDVHTYGTSNTRLAVGTNDQILTADSAQTEGIKWAAAAGDGTIEFAPLFNDWGTSQPAGWLEEITTGGSVTYNTTLAVATGTTANGSVNIGHFLPLGYGKYRMVATLSGAIAASNRILAGIAEYEGETGVNIANLQNACYIEFASAGTEDLVTCSAGTCTNSADAATDPTVSQNYDIYFEDDAVEYLVGDASKATNTNNIPLRKIMTFWAGAGVDGSGSASSQTLTITSFEARAGSR